VPEAVPAVGNDQEEGVSRWSTKQDWDNVTSTLETSVRNSDSSLSIDDNRFRIAALSSSVRLAGKDMRSGGVGYAG